jgi:hypothetical protein
MAGILVPYFDMGRIKNTPMVHMAGFLDYVHLRYGRDKVRICHLLEYRTHLWYGWDTGRVCAVAGIQDTSVKWPGYSGLFVAWLADRKRLWYAWDTVKHLC